MRQEERPEDRVDSGNGEELLTYREHTGRRPFVLFVPGTVLITRSIRQLRRTNIPVGG